MTLDYLIKNWRSAVLLITYVFGVLFFMIIPHEMFDAMVPYHLLFSFLIIVVHKGSLDKKLLLFFIVSGGLGYLVEYLGVNYGLLFGDYYYTQKLGIRVAGVPLIIALMWFQLNYAVVIMLLKKVSSALLRIVLGAFLVTMIDVLLEPLAIKMDWWQWAGQTVPLSNYMAWCITSLVILLVFNLLYKQREDKTAVTYLFCVILFFVVMNALT